MFIGFCLFGGISCGDGAAKPARPLPKTEISSGQPIDNPDAKEARHRFFSLPFQYLIWISPPTVNTYPTEHYYYSFPKAAALSDYNQKSFRCLMAVNFSWPFEHNLPKEILNELSARNLLDKKLVDIFWVIQPLENLGGNSSGSDHNITYLKAHGWADPDEPLDYVGTRLDRRFLYGLFDADVDISYDVLLNQMKPFEIHVHDGQYSPQTAAVRLPSAEPDSMAFWSLVIDHENPNHQVRALATLHWLISRKDMKNFWDETFKPGERIDSRGIKRRGDVPQYPTIGDYISMLETKSFLKNTSLVKKLRSLVGR